MKFILTKNKEAVPSCWKTGTRKQSMDLQSVYKMKGFWIWWCEGHHQPKAWCEKQAWESYAQSLLKRLKDVAYLAQGAEN